MGSLLEIVTPNHVSTKRDYFGRMSDEKVRCMEVAKQYDFDYWDGERRYGYGGYRFIPGWWEVVATKLIEHYKLSSNSTVLDVGCGKGFLLRELKNALPGLEVRGFDISDYALEHAHQEVQPYLRQGLAQKSYPYRDQEFDLVISINCLHNLDLKELSEALAEIERVGQEGFVVMESYRNEDELFNLQCWALTADSFLQPREWKWLFDQVGYSGDFEFIFFS